MPSPNIYHAVVFDLHPKVREFLDGLDQAGQVDQDETKAPHIIAVDSPAASVYRCVFLRNGQPENFVLHTRRKVSPVQSWKEDGWVRPVQMREPEVDAGGKRRERERHVYESLMDQILPRR